jgi:hypothetical protein
MNSTTIAVDVAKAVFEVAVSEHPGQVRERHRFSRERFRRRSFARTPVDSLGKRACPRDRPETGDNWGAPTPKPDGRRPEVIGPPYNGWVSV